MDRERMHGKVRLRPMREQDLSFVVREHRRYFPGGFFARLGPGFLAAYYRTFLHGPQARCVIAEDDKEHVGYLVGLIDPAAHREHVIRRYGVGLALRAAVAMLARPRMAMTFLRTRSALYARRLLGRRTSSSGGHPSHVRTAVLTQVSVTPSARSQGLGSTLIDWFDREAAAAGCDQLMLVTAAGDGAGAYYRTHGWEACDERRTPDGLALTTYRRPAGRRAIDRGEHTG